MSASSIISLSFCPPHAERVCISGVPSGSNTDYQNKKIYVVLLQNHIKRTKEETHALKLTVTNAKSMEGGSSGESASDTAPDIEVSTALILALEGVRW